MSTKVSNAHNGTGCDCAVLEDGRYVVNCQAEQECNAIGGTTLKQTRIEIHTIWVKFKARGSRALFFIADV